MLAINEKFSKNYVDIFQNSSTYSYIVSELLSCRIVTIIVPSNPYTHDSCSLHSAMHCSRVETCKFVPGEFTLYRPYTSSCMPATAAAVFGRVARSLASPGDARFYTWSDHSLRRHCSGRDGRRTRTAGRVHSGPIGPSVGLPFLSVSPSARLVSDAGPSVRWPTRSVARPHSILQYRVCWPPTITNRCATRHETNDWRAGNCRSMRCHLANGRRKPESKSDRMQESRCGAYRRTVFLWKCILGIREKVSCELFNEASYLFIIVICILIGDKLCRLEHNTQSIPIYIVNV